MNLAYYLKNLFEPIKFNRPEWLLVLIFTIEILFPQHTVQAAEQLNNDLIKNRAVITEPLPPIPHIQDLQEESSEFAEGSLEEAILTKNLEKAKYTTYITVTAYSSTRDQTDSTPYLTASQTFVRDGVVASNYFRYGTKLRFPDVYGDKIFIVEDRMNSRYFKRIDIWMPARQPAKYFGIKKLKVEIVE